MTSYPLLASLAPEHSLEDQTPLGAPPLPPNLRVHGATLACPDVWAASAAGRLKAGSALTSWRLAGAVVVDRRGALSGLTREGFREIPLERGSVEAVLRHLDPHADEFALTLGISALLGLVPLLTQEDARLAVNEGAQAVTLERWRAPAYEEGELEFFAGADPVLRVHVDLSRAWIEVEHVCQGWKPPAYALALLHPLGRAL